MQILSNLFEIKLSESTIATIGTFDGIHIGHQKILNSLVRFARENSFVTKSSGTWGGADKDLAAKVRASKK